MRVIRIIICKMLEPSVWHIVSAVCLLWLLSCWLYVNYKHLLYLHQDKEVQGLSYSA